MDFLETLASRNAEFAQSGFSADLKMLPTGLVYDVKTGHVATVVPPVKLRSEQG
jgi:hypothetical protein